VPYVNPPPIKFALLALVLLFASGCAVKPPCEGESAEAEDCAALVEKERPKSTFVPKPVIRRYHGAGSR
jgi:hypothetical protein